MDIKNKIVNAITAHPRLVVLGIGLAVTFVIGAAIGITEHEAFASSSISTGGAGSR
jgi:hypothetical protein